MSNAPRVGRVVRFKRDDLWYYDRLPPTARQALANAAFDWAAGAFYNRWKKGQRGYKTGPDIAARIAHADASVISRIPNR